MNFNKRCKEFTWKFADRQRKNGPKDLNIIMMRKSKSSTHQDAIVQTTNHHNGRTYKPSRPMIQRNNQKYAQ
jgi:hypothetical protein